MPEKDLSWIFQFLTFYRFSVERVVLGWRIAALVTYARLKISLITFSTLSLLRTLLSPRESFPLFDSITYL